MNLNESVTEDGWCFAWTTRAGHEIELEYLANRGRWLRRFRNHDPEVPDPPWTPAQPVRLPKARDRDHARQIAIEHVDRRNP